jgi:hypothetical protein
MPEAGDMTSNKGKWGQERNLHCFSAAGPDLNLFTPHPSFSDEVNRNIAQSESKVVFTWTSYPRALS